MQHGGAGIMLAISMYVLSDILYSMYCKKHNCDLIFALVIEVFNQQKLICCKNVNVH